MRNRRHTRLAKPDFQLRFGIAFAGVAASAIVLYTVILHFSMTQVIGITERGSIEIVDLPRLLLANALATAALMLPIAIIVGVIAVFPIAGPLFHIERHLRQFLDGNDLGRCELRRGDRLVRLNLLIERVLDRVREAEKIAATASARQGIEVDDPPAVLPSEPEYEDHPEYLA